MLSSSCQHHAVRKNRRYQGSLTRRRSVMEDRSKLLKTLRSLATAKRSAVGFAFFASMLILTLSSAHAFARSNSLPNPGNALQSTQLCFGFIPTIVGTAGNDVLVGTAGPDIINGLGGDDAIDGLAGDDIICGRNGSDHLSGGPGNDVLLGGSGNDVLKGERGDDNLKGGSGSDEVFGGHGNDILSGGGGDDNLVCGTGVDSANGKTGDDLADESCEQVSKAAYSNAPNIILIVSDDQPASTLSYMDNLQSLLAAGGAQFDNFFVTTPVCCPSRATILRGQYAHNHTVHTNVDTVPNGGYPQALTAGLEDSNIATLLDMSDFETVHIGKYLNGYPIEGNETYIPPGWDKWYAYTTRKHYKNMLLNENGNIVQYGNTAADYSTDVFSGFANDFITTRDGRMPFFMMLTPFAPHLPAKPALRHEGIFDGLTAPRPPSFNEADVSDKSLWLQGKSLLTVEEIASVDTSYADQIETLMAVDEMIGDLFQSLSVTGELDNTVVIYLTDNGIFRGEHRKKGGKGLPYDGASRVGFYLKGPGIEPAQTSSAITSTIDIVPTVLELTGVQAPDYIDGRSLLPVLNNGGVIPPQWRDQVLIEYWSPHGGPNQAPNYKALRSDQTLYIEWDTGETELYDLVNDPFQLSSIHNSVAQSVLDALSLKLDALRVCSASVCRDADQ